MMDYLKTVKNGGATVQGYSEYVKGLGKSFNGTAFAAKALTIALNVGLMIAISTVIHVISEFTNAQEKNAQKAKEAQEAIISESESVENLIKQYKNLATSGDWNNESRDTAKEIQEKLTELVGDEAKNLDLVNGKLDDQITKLRAIEIQTLKNKENALIAAANTAQQEYEGKKGSSSWLWGNYQYAFAGSMTKEDIDAIELLDDKVNGLKASMHGLIPVIELENESLLDNAEKIAIIDGALESLKTAGLSNTDVFTQLQTSLQGYKDTINAVDKANKDLNENSAKILIATKLQTEEIPKTTEEYKAFKDELIASATAVDSTTGEYTNSFRGTSEEVTAAIETILSSIKEFDTFTRETLDNSDYIDEISSSFQKFHDIIARLQQAQSEIKSTGAVSLETYNKLKSADESIGDLFTFSANGIQLNAKALDEYIPKLEQQYAAEMLTNGATQEQISQLFNLSDALLKADNSLTGFKKAQTEMQHLVAMGKITQEEYIDWLDTAYQDAYSGVEKSEENLAEIYKYQEEVLKGRQEALNNTITSLEEQYGIHQNEKQIISDLIILASRYGDVLSDAQKQSIDSKIKEYTIAGYNNAVTDLEHQVSLLKQRNATESEILPIYDKMQGKLKELAKYYKSLGYDSNSTEIQNVQKQQIQLMEDASDTVVTHVGKLEKLYETHQNESRIITELNSVLSTYNDVLSETDKLDIQSKIQEYTIAGYNNVITDLEHQIKLIQLRNENESASIPIYKQMQTEVSKLIEYYRSLGFDEFSNEIQAAQEQLLEISNSISDIQTAQFDKKVAGYNDYITDLEHQITLINSRNNSEAKSIPIYREIQEQLKELENYYRSIGLDDNSTEIQEVQKRWIDLANTIEDSYTKMYESRRNSLEYQIQDLERTENTEKQRIELYRDAQEIILEQQRYYISLGYNETSSQLQELKQQYQNYADSINSIMEESYNKNIEAQRKAIEQERDILQERIDATNTVIDAVVDSIKRKKQAEINEIQDILDAENEKYEVAKDNIEKHYDDLISKAKDSYEERKTSMTQYYDSLIEQSKKASESEIKSIDNQIDAYKRIIEAKKDNLRAERETDEYRKNVAEKNRDIASIQQEIESIQFDTSMDAQTKRLELQEQLAEKNIDLFDYQEDYATDKKIEALDKEFDAYSAKMNRRIELIRNENEISISLYEQEKEKFLANLEEENNAYIRSLESRKAKELDDIKLHNERLVEKYDNQIAMLEDYIAQEGTIREEANQMVLSGNTDMWNEIIAYEKKYNSDVASLQNAWNIATSSMDKYNNSQLKSVQTLSQMLSLLDKYNNKLSALENSSYKSSQYGIVPKYHSGGVVGNVKSKKQDEILTLLEKGEIVANDRMQGNIFKLADYAKNSQNLLSSLSNMEIPLNNDLLSSHKNAMSNISNINNAKNESVKMDFNFNVGNINSENIPMVQQKIDDLANKVIRKIEAMFTRKGNTTLLNKSI